MSAPKAPKQKNRSQFFSAAGATFLTLLIVVAFVVFVLLGNGIRSGNRFSAAVISAVLVDLTNQSRTSNQLDGLTVNPTLVAIAQAKANDMAAKGYFAHTSPDGKDPWYWFQQGGYQFSYAGENLAIDFSDSSDVETAWMNSPAHRANILNSHFTQIGIATAEGEYQGHHTIYVVQEFGTPASVLSAPTTPKALTTTTNPNQIAIATTKPTTKPATIPAKPKTITPTKPPISSQLATVPTPSRVVLGESTTTQSPTPSLIDRMTASPRESLKFIYYIIGALILLAIVVETGLEFKKHHMRHVVMAFSILILMGGLFYIASQTVFHAPVVATGSTASIVE